MTANNETIIIDKNLQEFDAVSLYSSAMYIMNGIPKGIPKVLSDQECQNKSFKKIADDYNRFTLVFSFENGIMVFRVQCYKNFYVDKRSLEDLIEFCDIEFDVLRGRVLF